MPYLLPSPELEYIKLGLNRLGLKNLNAYYDSHWWKERKQRFYQSHEYVCRCGCRKKLQLHHRTYQNIGRERDEDLEYKCNTCHRREHRKWERKVVKGRRAVKELNSQFYRPDTIQKMKRMKSRHGFRSAKKVPYKRKRFLAMLLDPNY